MTPGTAGLSLDDNPDTMKNVVQNVIDDALCFNRFLICFDNAF